jgi:hypothetical protein
MLKYKNINDITSLITWKIFYFFALLWQSHSNYCHGCVLEFIHTMELSILYPSLLKVRILGSQAVVNSYFLYLNIIYSVCNCFVMIQYGLPLFPIHSIFLSIRHHYLKLSQAVQSFPYFNFHKFSTVRIILLPPSVDTPIIYCNWVRY